MEGYHDAAFDVAQEHGADRRVVRGRRDDLVMANLGSGPFQRVPE